GDLALHRAGIGPELGHGAVERFLAAAEDEDERALLDEALCRGAADAGSATGDHGGLSIQSVHVMDPWLGLHKKGSLEITAFLFVIPAKAGIQVAVPREQNGFPLSRE